MHTYLNRGRHSGDMSLAASIRLWYNRFDGGCWNRLKNRLRFAAKQRGHPTNSCTHVGDREHFLNSPSSINEATPCPLAGAGCQNRQGPQVSGKPPSLVPGKGPLPQSGYTRQYSSKFSLHRISRMIGCLEMLGIGDPL